MGNEMYRHDESQRGHATLYVVPAVHMELHAPRYHRWPLTLNHLEVVWVSEGGSEHSCTSRSVDARRSRRRAHTLSPVCLGVNRPGVVAQHMEHKPVFGFEVVVPRTTGKLTPVELHTTEAVVNRAISPIMVRMAAMVRIIKPIKAH